MGNAAEEKRNYPRVKTNLKAGVSKKNFAETVDLSEGGISLNSTEKISSPSIFIKIQFPEGDFSLSADARLIWERDLGGSRSLYGLEFVDLTKQQKSGLRRELINTQIMELLTGIKGHEPRKLIAHFFLKDVLDYTNELLRLAEELSHNRVYSVESQKRLDHFTAQVLLKGYCLEELLSDNRIMDEVKDNFRKLAGTWFYKGAIVKRAFEKPRGYPGDYKTLDIIYDNKPLSMDFGLYSDNSFLKSPYAVAVRIRKDRLRELIQEFINNSTLKKVEILNIACGPCREIKELLPCMKNGNPVIFTCLDRDEEALDFSKKSLLRNPPPNVTFKFIKEDIMNMIKNESPEQAYGKYDLVYSMGLIDYLPDNILKKLMPLLFRLLKTGGSLIVTHKNREKTYPSLPPDWFCDWKFVPRNKDETIKLFHDSGLSGFSLSTQSDDFGYIYYFEITKK